MDKSGNKYLGCRKHVYGWLIRQHESEDVVCLDSGNDVRVVHEITQFVARSNDLSIKGGVDNF